MSDEGKGRWAGGGLLVGAKANEHAELGAERMQSNSPPGYRQDRLPE